MKVINDNRRELMHYEEESQRVLKVLTEDYVCINYVTLHSDRYDDALISYRTSERFKKEIPGWEDEHNFHNKLNLLIDNVVHDEDKGMLFEGTRRDLILEQLKKQNNYTINFRAVLDGEIVYYQIRFTPDRINGVIVGMVASIRNVDREMRTQISHENEIADAYASSERVIMGRTAELQEKNRELARTNDEVVELLGDLVELRDRESGLHVKRVKAYTKILAEQVAKEYPEYGLDEAAIERITSASALHDVGKIMISDTILLKPGKLTKEEFDLMKTHCDKGVEVLKSAPKSWSAQYLSTAMNICLCHHEKWDGSGYPRGLKGDDIPISAQIVSIADCYDALTSKRVYKPAYSTDEAYHMIMNGEVGAFSEKILKCFTDSQDRFIKTAADPRSVVDAAYVSAYGIDKLYGIKILLVDDNEISLEINCDILEGEGATVITATNGLEAIDKFQNESPFDVIVMDVVMPELDGIEATKRIRAIEAETESEDHVPIIALTAEASTDNTEMLTNAGADASMAKPLVIGEFTRIMLSCMKNKSVSIEKKLEDTMKLANTDALTKVKNITAFTDMSADLNNELKDNPDMEFAIVMCDVNKLKMVNDTYGHSVGDQYIINSCNLICNTFTHSPVYRVGGDEFVAILQGTDYNNRDEKMVELYKAVEHASLIPEFRDGRASLAAGMAEYDKETDSSVSDVTQRADSNMYADKTLMRRA